MRRSAKRSLVKALTYRIICSTETFLITWLVTGSWKAGGVVSGTLLFTKVGTYFIHERLWEYTPWGIKNE